MENDNDLLKSLPLSKAFFRLAVPGVGVTAPVILAISAFAALVSMGGAPKASIYMGQGDNKLAEKVSFYDEEECLAEKDQRRKLYYRHYTGQEWGNVVNYRLAVNISMIKITQAAEWILSLY